VLIPDRLISPPDGPQIAELEQELQATRAKLQSALRHLDISSGQRKATNEKSASVKKELIARNAELNDALERQRTRATDLENILYSTDVATVLLDIDLNIRFFTPATRLLFGISPSDVGRPLADLTSLATDDGLLTEARAVLRTGLPADRDIAAQNGAWYTRRIFPYHSSGLAIEGVVIIFADITDRRHTADELKAAERQAQLDNRAKSRFLAAASHDLRQPLQTLKLMRGLLTKRITDTKTDEGLKLVARLDETASAMSGMLNSLLDINQLETGTIYAEPVDFQVNDLLDRLRGEFTYQAESHGLALHVVPCSLSVKSDPRLLEQMLRNLLANAMKYTESGKVLLGCRRREGILSIEIRDTGVGIPDSELQAIFDEYHQLDNAPHERSRGLGLGLSIVQRLSVLLGHRVRVYSRPGQGSVFAIDVVLDASGAAALHEGALRRGGADARVKGIRRSGAILVVEDNSEVRELLELFLRDEGHNTASAPDARSALTLVAHGTFRPDIVLADYDLPTGMDGLEMGTALRERLHRRVPVIILTGDISTNAVRAIALNDFVQLNKPVKPKLLVEAIQRLLAISYSSARVHAPQILDAATAPRPPIIFIVDDDSHVRAGIRELLEDEGRIVEDYPTCEAFLDGYRPGREACLLIDAYLPGMSGLELLRQLHHADHRLPAIMITGSSDVAMAVQAMKAGASDFIEKPISGGELLAAIERALEQSRDSSKLYKWRETAANHIADLTPRQCEIMKLVLAGHPSKNIAADLGISQRTVENHRAAIMHKTGTKSLPALARLAIAAAGHDGEEPLAEPASVSAAHGK
jgi:two-component system CheB/CheR fusion protein